MTSQNQQILSHLKLGKTINPMEALTMFGSFRLAARVYQLKSKGWPISCSIQTMENGKTIGTYSLHMDTLWWPKE